MKNILRKNNSSLKSKIYHALLVFSIILILIPVIFIVQMVSIFNDSTSNLSEQVSNTIINKLENNFLNIEQSSISLSVASEVENTLKSTTVLDFYTNAHTVKIVLDQIYADDGLVDDILIYTADGVFSRLRGDLGNTSANRVFKLLQNVENTSHMSLVLEDTNYIGYVSCLELSDGTIGYIVYLMKNSDISEFFKNSDYNDTLEIGLVAEDYILVSTNDDHTGILVSQQEKEVSTFSIKQIGFSPYKIIVANEPFVQAYLPNILIIIFMSLLGIIFILVFAYNLMGKMFFSPMLKIIDSAEKLKTTDEKIALTGQLEFDVLVEQINSMVSRIAKNSNDIYSMKIQMQTSEIEKQQATIIALKKQINAHFIVNTLNVLRRLIDKNEHKKSKFICEGLSSILRYVYNADENISCLEEVTMLEEYVKIMKIRYPNRFSAEFELPDYLFDVQIPRMLVQPVVENAIIHGCASERGHNISVDVVQEENDILFIVKDDGKGMKIDKLKNLQREIMGESDEYIEDQGIENIALRNIQRRLSTIFGEEYGVTIESEHKVQTVVTIKLPILSD